MLKRVTYKLCKNSNSNSDLDSAFQRVSIEINQMARHGGSVHHLLVPLRSFLLFDEAEVATSISNVAINFELENISGI